MPKKRVIFTLLYDSGGFMLSRNFRLQRAGDVRWLLKNYRFYEMSPYIDELMIVNVTRGAVDQARFIEDVRQIVEGCFVPVCLGGAVDSVEMASFLIANGADKIVVNTLFDTAPHVVRSIADLFGAQCVVGGIDLKRSEDGEYVVYSKHGELLQPMSPQERVEAMLAAGAGELLLQSINRDGTGQGFDTRMIGSIGSQLDVPLILCGGCGKGEHMFDALDRNDVDAIATANLFNFIGDGLQAARMELLQKGMDLARWDVPKIKSLRNVLRSPK